MTSADLIALQNTTLLGAMILVAIWERLRPHQPFASSRDRWMHIGLNLGFGLASIVIASLLLGQAGPRLQSWGETNGVGALAMVPLPLWAIVVVGVLIADLSDYLFHRFCHEWRVLWLMHSVHHSDLQLDVSTSVRTHPGQMVFAVAWRLLVAFAIGVPVWVVLLRDVFALANVVLHHANISWPERIDAKLRLMFVTPAMHKVHHSPDAVENNANYGSLFSFWDRLFGTYAEADANASSEYGLRRLADARHQSVLGMLLTPWRARHYREL